MRFLRILPAVWAMISWSFSSFTRNVALGSSSVTTPGNSSISSLAIHFPSENLREEWSESARKSRARSAKRRADRAQMIDFSYFFVSVDNQIVNCGDNPDRLHDLLVFLNARRVIARLDGKLALPCAADAAKPRPGISREGFRRLTGAHRRLFQHFRLHIRDAGEEVGRTHRAIFVREDDTLLHQRAGIAVGFRHPVHIRGPQYDLLGDDEARVELAARIHLGEAVGHLRGLQLDFVFREAVLLQESANHFRIALHLCLRFGEIIARHDKAQRPKREIGLHFPFGKPFYRNSAVAEARLHKT